MTLCEPVQAAGRVSRWPAHRVLADAVVGEQACLRQRRGGVLRVGKVGKKELLGPDVVGDAHERLKDDLDSVVPGCPRLAIGDVGWLRQVDHGRTLTRGRRRRAGVVWLIWMRTTSAEMPDISSMNTARAGDVAERPSRFCLRLIRTRATS